MPNVLIIGATRGLGASLASLYVSSTTSTSDNKTFVYGTTRAAEGPASSGFAPGSVQWIPYIDATDPRVGAQLVNQLGMRGLGRSITGGEVDHLDVVIITAGYFGTEDFESGPKWDEEVKMYTTSAISPPFIVHSLVKAKLLKAGAKVVLVSSESGSITLRHESEGGGNYAHHASKAALNMVGKLLSLDVKEMGIIISIVHPGFMRTEMTKGVGFDKYWDDGGAVTPNEAAKSLIEWTDKLDMSKSGEYWAPRGPRDIGTAEPVLGKNLSTPLHLPW